MLGSSYKELKETIAGLISELAGVKAEREWLESEEARLRLAMQQVPAIVWKTDADLRVVWSEGAGLALWGFFPPGHLGRRLTDVFGTADLNYPPLSAARRALEGEPSQYTQDFRGRTFQSLVKPLRDSSGKVTGTVGVTLEITAQRRAAEAAQVSEARLAGIINISEDAIIAVDAGQNITLFNPGAEKIFGYSAEEAMGRPLDLLLPARFIEAHRRHVWEFARSGEVLRPMNERGEIYGRRKDGTEFPAEASISRFEIAGETVLNVRLRDISERKLAEEQLHARARQQSAVADIGLRALRDRDRNALMRDACEAVAGALRVEFAEVLEALPDGESLLLLAGTGWGHGIAGHRILHGGPGSLAAYTLGSSQPVILRDLRTERRFEAPLLAEHGVVSGMTVIIHGQDRPFGLLGAYSAFPRAFTRDDINFLQAVSNVLAEAIERMRAEEALRVFNETLQVVNEAAPAAIISVDLEGNVQFWNPAATRLFGWTEAEVLGRPLPTIPEGRSDEFKSKLEKLRRGERMTGVEVRRRRKDGSVVDVGIWTAPLRDGSGTIRASLIVAVDLTERKRVEEQLRQTQKLESIGLLAGGVAHDFNNLLTGIIGNISLALDEARPNELIRRHLERALNSSERAADLVRQLLAYAGKGRFVLEPIDLSALVRDMTPLLETTLPKQARLELQLGTDVPLVESDRSQVQQIVINLATNAAEAIGDRAGTVLIRTGTRDVGGESELAPGKYACLEVCDDGSGMDPETAAQIFDPFFSTKFTGRGLGLAAVSGIVRSHKGTIHVASEPGRGSTFEVLLPALAQSVAT